ncbi:hypothetical protein JCM15831A_05990 [Asaia astilbis]
MLASSASAEGVSISQSNSSKDGWKDGGIDKRALKSTLGSLRCRKSSAKEEAKSPIRLVFAGSSESNRKSSQSAITDLS